MVVVRSLVKCSAWVSRTNTLSRCSLALLTVAVLGYLPLSTTAYAQGGNTAEPSPSASASGSHSASVPPVQTNAAVSGVSASSNIASSSPSVSQPFRCELGRDQGVSHAPAVTIKNVLCEHVRTAGGAGRYRVDLEPLERKIVLTLVELSPTGDTIDQRMAVLESLDEGTIAAPRLARSLISHVPFNQTARIDNLLKEETTPPIKKPAHRMWSLGPLATLVKSGDSHVGLGVDFGLLYELDWVAFGALARAVKGPNSAGELEIFSFSMLFRQFFSSGDSTLFWGTGLSLSSMSVEVPTSIQGDTSNAELTLSGNGLGSFAELGFEAFRLYDRRLVLSARFDIPFYKLKGDASALVPADDSAASSYSDHVWLRVPMSNYVVPFTLSASCVW